MTSGEPIFWILAVGLLIYEFWTLYWTPAPDDHITAIVRRVIQRPLVLFALGMLMGHFVWC